MLEVCVCVRACKGIWLYSFILLLLIKYRFQACIINEPMIHLLIYRIPCQRREERLIQELRYCQFNQFQSIAVKRWYSRMEREREQTIACILETLDVVAHFTSHLCIVNSNDTSSHFALLRFTSNSNCKINWFSKSIMWKVHATALEVWRRKTDVGAPSDRGNGQEIGYFTLCDSVTNYAIVSVWRHAHAITHELVFSWQNHHCLH